MSAINSALATIDEIGAEGEMDANLPEAVSFDLEAVAEPIVLPDGKRIYPPLLFGEPIDAVACKLIDVHESGGQPVPAADWTARNGQVAGRQGHRLQAVARARQRGDQPSRQPVLRAGRDAARAEL